MANPLAKKRSSFFEPVIDFFKGFHKRFVDGSLGVKLSHFICGAGNLYHKQIVKGILFLLLQALFIFFMIYCPEVNGTPFGYKALGNLVLQGTEGGIQIVNGRPVNLPPSNSVLMLLFGIVTIGVIAVYFIIWFSNIKSAELADLAVEQGRKPSSFADDCKSLLDDRFHVLMLTPTLVACLIFTIIPTIFMISMAFTTYNTIDMKIAKTNLFHWNGLDNFVNMFTGGTTLGAEIKNRFIPVLIWTMVWAVFATFSCYFGGIILAILINKKGVKGKKIFRTVFIMTIALPTFISLLAVRNLLNSNGPVNSMLMNLGWIDEPISFFQLNSFDNEPMIARVMVIIINMWVGIPYTMLMTSGILMNIPTDLYEAATVDGASKMKMFFKITLPYIIFVTTPYLIGSFIGNINSFIIIFLLTGGGPAIPGSMYSAGQTDLLVTWLYKLTITDGQYNTGAVVGILTFAITSTITLLTYRNSKAYKEEDTFQ